MIGLLFCLGVIQNNKALKPFFVADTAFVCLRVIQNNKALKPIYVKYYVTLSLRVIQNNKALKLTAPNLSV